MLRLDVDWARDWSNNTGGHPYGFADEERLRSLPPEQYAELAHSGALGLAYVQLFSRPRIADLQFRHRKQPGPGAKAERHLHAVEGDSLDTMFGQGGDEFTFDFDR